MYRLKDDQIPKKAVVVEWDDAVYDPDNLKPSQIEREWVLQDTGFLIELTSQRVVIATSWSRRDNRFRHSHSIPRKMIRKIRTFDLTD